ncbi:hypothetical protein FPRO03_13029 [Fusarium proliferatum]|nr:hypothetical protein FPRO03_13029 [Fusarium proliferatum]
MKLTFTRYLNRRICAYRVSKEPDNSIGPMEPAATYKAEPESNEEIHKILTHDVASDLSRAVYCTRNSVVCVGQDGDVLWRYELEPHSTVLHGHVPDSVFSLDGSTVWVYRPDAMANRGDDKWVALGADTGKVLAEMSLGTVGHGGQHVLHPDGQHILLDVGEGQDGSSMFRATVADDHFDFYKCEFEDRVPIDIAPNGRHFMTVHHVGVDVAFHLFPNGEVVLRLTLEDLGYANEGDNEDELQIYYIGGFLDSDIAVVAVESWNDREEWRNYHRVDLRTGTVSDCFEAHSQEGYDFEPLGDGTWITSGPDGNPVRYRWPNCDEADEL